MASRVLALSFLLGIASIANATATINLVPDNPGTYGALEYDPGEVLNVSVMVDNPSQEINLRLIQWDVSGSDSALTFNDTTGDFIPNFVFTLNEFDNALYATFPTYPVVSAAYQGQSANPLFQFGVPAGGSASTGTINLTLPTAPGDYLLDIFNSGNTDNNLGASLLFGFGVLPGDDITVWRGDLLGDERLNGGSILLTVVPEPATLSLLALGAFAAIRRRRKA